MHIRLLAVRAIAWELLNYRDRKAPAQVEERRVPRGQRLLCFVSSRGIQRHSWVCKAPLTYEGGKKAALRTKAWQAQELAGAQSPPPP